MPQILLYGKRKLMNEENLTILQFVFDIIEATQNVLCLCEMIDV